MSIKISICYANTPEANFDQSYYVEKHIPLIKELFTPHGLQKIEVAFPLPQPNGESAPYRAIADLYFESLEALGACMTIAGKEVTADVSNYTNIVPSTFVSRLL